MNGRDKKISSGAKILRQYRVVDSKGNTIDFYLSKTRDKRAAKCFFKKALRPLHVSKPRVSRVYKKRACPIAREELKKRKAT